MQPSADQPLRSTPHAINVVYYGPKGSKGHDAGIYGTALVGLRNPLAVLDRELTRLPANSRRNRARFGTRRSLAYALAGEIDQSCVTLAETIEDAAQVDSATVRADLRELSQCLNRWRSHHAVREVCPRLSRVLQRHPAMS